LLSPSSSRLKAGKYTATVIRKAKEIRIRGIELADVKTVTKKEIKAKEWLVEGDDDKAKEDENAKSRQGESRDAKKERMTSSRTPAAG